MSSSGPGPGPGQVQVRSRSGRSEIDLSLTLFLVFTTHPPPHKLFSQVVDTKAKIKWDYRGDVREYFNESKIV